MKSFFRLFYSKTTQIKDTEGNLKPNSITSLEKVNLGGLDQWIIIRGHDKNNPILLFLHGGPGSVEGPLAYKFESELEKHFIFVNWDQRGAGKSYSKRISKESMKLDQFISDTIELINLLRSRFNQKKVYLVGHSWGSILGILCVQRYPELFYAYIGIGQVINIRENEKLSYDFVNKQAKILGNEKALKQLEKIQPYTGENIKNLKIQRKWLAKFGGFMHGEKSMWPLIKIGLFSPEYSIKDIFKFYKGINFSMENIWSKLFEINFFNQVSEIKVPVYFCVGRYDYNTPFELVERFYEQLKAPKKKLIWFEKSAHNPNFEEHQKFNDLLINQILPETYKNKK
jgi:pimeloyl-ACP methyl ester carboxylesterase